MLFWMCLVDWIGIFLRILNVVVLNVLNIVECWAETTFSVCCFAGYPTLALVVNYPHNRAVLTTTMVKALAVARKFSLGCWLCPKVANQPFLNHQNYHESPQVSWECPVTTHSQFGQMFNCHLYKSLRRFIRLSDLLYVNIIRYRYTYIYIDIWLMDGFKGTSTGNLVFVYYFFCVLYMFPSTDPICRLHGFSTNIAGWHQSAFSGQSSFTQKKWGYFFHM